MTRALALLALACVTAGAGWLDPHATARQAARLYADGKYDDAAAAYNQALIDDPDSARLHVNLGAAEYRRGRYEEAIAALGRVPATEADAGRAARVAYDAGNARYRLGAAAEAAEPEKALALWAEALVAYRRAMGAAPADTDAKFNHELVERRIAELRKKLEEKKQQQEEPEPQGQQQPQQDQAKPEEQQGQEQQQQQQREQPDGQAADEKGEQPEQGEAPAEPEPQQAEGAEGRQGDDAASAPADGKLSEADAQAILDAQRDREVRPDEVLKKLQGARVAGPREDW